MARNRARVKRDFSYPSYFDCRRTLVNLTRVSTIPTPIKIAAKISAASTNHITAILTRDSAPLPSGLGMRVLASSTICISNMLTSSLDQLRSQLPQSRPFVGRRAAAGANSSEPDSQDREPTDKESEPAVRRQAEFQMDRTSEGQPVGRQYREPPRR